MADSACCKMYLFGVTSCLEFCLYMACWYKVQGFLSLSISSVLFLLVFIALLYHFTAVRVKFSEYKLTTRKHIKYSHNSKGSISCQRKNFVNVSIVIAVITAYALWHATISFYAWLSLNRPTVEAYAISSAVWRIGERSFTIYKWEVRSPTAHWPMQM